MINFPSMKTKELIKCLCRYTLCYKIIRQRGSHRTLKSEHYPVLRISYHDSVEISGFRVKKILTQEVGLTEIMAIEVIK